MTEHVQPEESAEGPPPEDSIEEKDTEINEALVRAGSPGARSDDTGSQQQYDSMLSSSLVKEPPSEISRVEVQKYSVFTTNEKRLIISAGSLAGFFSPLSSSIYFPALNTISAALNVSGSKINLTITSYVILQGIAPMMIAGFSDNVGRRPAYVICFTIYMFANLGLGLQNSYAALLVLRCLQSAGSSATIALSNGLVGDMVTSEERGSYIAFASLGGLLGPAIAPIIGGAICQTLDWHWVFWFLLIFAGAFCVPLFLFMPETCRKIVGDGSIPPPRWHWCLTDSIRYRRRQKKGIEIDKIKQAELRKNVRIQLPNPIPTLLIIFDPESLIILIATGLCLACFYAISTGAASSLGDVYGFNDIQIALMFIPLSGGGALAALTTGKMVDWNYRRHARKQGINIVKGVRQDLANFPIEKARLELGIPASILCAVFVIGYGWTMDHKVSLAGPIILIFLIGYTTISTYQTYNVLMVDIWPGKPAAASAANNFVRCSLGAAASAGIDPMSKAMGRGWAYTTIALLQAAFVPFIFVLMQRGPQMRKAKVERRTRKGIQKHDAS